MNFDEFERRFSATLPAKEEKYEYTPFEKKIFKAVIVFAVFMVAQLIRGLL